MRQSTFQFRLGRGPGQGRRFPSLLVLIIGGVVLVGVIALVLFLGTIIAIAGLVASTAAALYFGTRRLLGKSLFSTPRSIPQVQSRPAPPPSSAPLSTQVREIEVEVLPDRK